MIASFVPTCDLIPGVAFPGDLDLLIIPYDNDRLMIARTIVIEVKVLRATHLRQGKAPNEYGFSQATAALSHGFPYAAVAHLIISDASPPREWRRVAVADVIDAETGSIYSVARVLC